MADIKGISDKAEEFEQALSDLLESFNAELSVKDDNIEVAFFQGPLDYLYFVSADCTGLERN